MAPEFWRLPAAAALSSARPLPSCPPIPDNTKGRGRGRKTHHLLRLLEISSLGGAPSQGASSSLSSSHRWAPTPRHRHASHPLTSSQPPSLAEAAHRCRWPSCPRGTGFAQAGPDTEILPSLGFSCSQWKTSSGKKWVRVSPLPLTGPVNPGKGPQFSGVQGEP